LTELTGDDLREIFARAARIEAGTLARRDGAAALFFPSSSLRTRVSFERGAAEMGLQPIVFPPEALDTVEDAVEYFQMLGDRRVHPLLRGSNSWSSGMPISTCFVSSLPLGFSRWSTR